jgi:structural maintenance of chromosomes protein 6
MHEKEKTYKGCNDAISAHKREGNDLRIALQRVESLVEELQDALDHDAVEEGRLDALKEHLLEAREENTTHEASYGDSILTLDKIREAMRISRDQMSALDLQIAEANAKIKKAEIKAQKVSTLRSDALQSKNAALEAVQVFEEGKKTIQGWRKEKIVQVTDFTAQASEICPRVRVDPGESGESLDRKLGKLHGDLKKYEEK